MPIQIGVADSSFSGLSPPGKLLETLFVPTKAIRQAVKVIKDLNLDGIQIAWREGLSAEKVEKITASTQILTVHAEVWTSWAQAAQESKEHGSGFYGFSIRFMPAFFGLFRPDEESDRFARNHNSYLVLHPGTLMNVVRHNPFWRLYKRDHWLLEPDWQRPGQRSQNIFISNPLAAAIIAKKYGIRCLFDTSHTGVTENKLELPWNIYCNELETAPPVIHFAAWVYKTDNPERDAGLDVSNRDRLGKSYDLLGEFFTRRSQEDWQGSIIIELSWSSMQGINADERIYGMVEFLKDCGISKGS